MKMIAVIAATTTAGLCAAYPLYPRSGASQCADTPPPPTQEVVAKPTPPPPAAPKKAAAPCTSPRTVAGATVTLKDGSVLKGELLSQEIVGNAIFRSDLALPVDIVKSVAFKGNGGEAKVELVNKDAFTMTIVDKSYKVKSTLGDLDVPCASIRQLSLSSRKACGDAEDGLVFHCTFDDEASVAAPAVGPSVKMELGKIIADKGKTGGALFVNPGIAGAQIAFPSGSFGTEGCIEFWANMASGKTEFTTGGDPRFFLLSTKDGTEIAHFEYASNNGCGNSGLGGHICGLRTQTNSGCSCLMPYSAVFKGEDYNGWHHYAFAWSTTELAIYVDGKLFCRTEGSLNAKQIAGDVIMDIPLNRLSGKSFNNKSAFYMDELKIWNKAKSEFDL